MSIFTRSMLTPEITKTIIRRGANLQSKRKTVFEVQRPAQGELKHWEKDAFRIARTNPFFLEAVGKTPIVFQMENGKIVEFRAQNLADYKRVSVENK